MSYSFNLPINSVSFGQISTAILRSLFLQKKEVCFFPVKEQLDFSSQDEDADFLKWVGDKVSNFNASHSRKNGCFKIWHLNGGLESLSENHFLMSFYELDSPTKEEINIAKNCSKLIFTNKETQRVFKEAGNVDSYYIPLFFDDKNFFKKETPYFDDGRIVFNLTGKFEKRKNHRKIIEAWVKKYGNNKKYSLQCAIYNVFLSEEQNKALFSQCLNGQRYNNVQFLGFLEKNSQYNDYLNSGNIILGVSGGEGWGLPEFHSVALGKHSVILNAHGYKEWASDLNSSLVNPSEKIDAYDGVFFKKGESFNQGRIYDFNEDDFIDACEKAIEKVNKNKINSEGLKLQTQFTCQNTVDEILKLF